MKKILIAAGVFVVGIVFLVVMLRPTAKVVGFRRGAQMRSRHAGRSSASI